MDVFILIIKEALHGVELLPDCLLSLSQVSPDIRAQVATVHGGQHGLLGASDLEASGNPLIWDVKVDSHLRLREGVRLHDILELVGSLLLHVVCSLGEVKLARAC